jgi:hypothetical protein
MSRNFLPEDIQQLQNAPAAPGWKAERYRANWLASLIIHTKRLANKIVSEITADHCGPYSLASKQEDADVACRSGWGGEP